MENLNVNQLEVVELNAAELQDIEGGIVPLVIGGLLAFDICLWGYILAN
jgi:lactobin A/cerein 7B family class IIb bacteriocin